MQLTLAFHSTVLSRRLLADILLVLALNAGKDYLLADVGVFWVLVRVLACGGLSVMIWFATVRPLQTKRVTEVCERLLAGACALPQNMHSGQPWAYHHYSSSYAMQDYSQRYIVYPLPGAFTFA